ncbi:bacillithiol biosynthesis deacetylase BshB1 [Phaeocystidibacter marisrubri]|uniref:Bacillithiol biosynthesis deacetylase BshB1 n=1 Tax=Phaeocystidibacter marisrubri TaxID=1577780 RepID=A0A6L3ZKV6_9FLAO|nr:bacillithiol biosynthesis deacetylase BshB1 [Phaeocystidibacter marisrubri]KAB2818168.1 bacillithiol biosynthesis deacetylase BshB1 [Phaeocystidibacter marisrubri]GGH71603.1 bacillithiol biosynthesis deacetylase BshB1 [Phaeocystidibacter marisrubri]
MKLDILAFGAHPDDVELGCAGTLAKAAAAGKKVGIVDLTLGDLGTRGTPEIRLKEAAKAGEILGLSARENLGFRDGFFQNDEEHKREVIRMIRKYQPDVVICNAPSDRHPDHGRGSELVVESAFYAGLRKIETVDQGVKQEAWRPSKVYHYVQFYDLKVDFSVDVTGFVDQKMASINAHESQFYNPNSDEPKTVISSKQFHDSITGRMVEWGRIIGVEHAEGFIVDRTLGVDQITDLI